MVAIRSWRIGMSAVGILFSTVELSSGAAAQNTRQAKAKWPLLHVPDPLASSVMGAVLDRASELLAEPGCAGVLTDFRDQHGRPLADRLVAMDVDIRTYVTMITFIDDSRHRHCASGAVAFTEPGGRVVRLCVDRLKEAWARDRTFTLAVVIHELLHTLGLGENPPSSREITKRVLARCSSNAREHGDVATPVVRAGVQDPSAIARYVELGTADHHADPGGNLDDGSDLTRSILEELDGRDG